MSIRDKQLTVYLSGPLTESEYPHNVLVNAGLAIGVFHHLLDMGFFPHCPQLSVFADLAQSQEHEKRLELNLCWLGKCDAMLKQGDSPTADREEDCAAARGIPVFTTVRELVKWAETHQASDAPRQTVASPLSLPKWKHRLTVRHDCDASLGVERVTTREACTAGSKEYHTIRVVFYIDNVDREFRSEDVLLKALADSQQEPIE